MTDWVAPDAVPASPAPPVAAVVAPPVPPASPSGRALLRARTVPQLVDGACRVLHRQGRVLVPAVLAVSVPLHVLVALAQRAVGLEPASVFNASVFDLGSAVDGGQLLVAYAGLAAESLVLAVLGVVVAHVVVADVLGVPLGLGPALGRGLRRLPTVAVAWLLAKLALVVGGCLLVGAVAVVVWTLVVSPVVAVEGLGPVKALGRSFTLTNRRWLSCLGVVALTALVATVVGLALSALPLLAGLLGPLEPYTWLLAALADVLSAVVVVPVVCGTAALAYLDLRVRTEGLDLQLELDRG